MKKLNQRGFGAIEWIIILIIIMAMIALGWYVAKTKKTTPTKTDSAQKTQLPAVKTTEKPAAKSTPATKKYLEINELGIKMELNTVTDDAYYIMKNGYAYISLTSLKTVAAECGADKTGVVSIGKYNKTDVDDQSGKTYGELAATDGKVIGSDAYVVSRSQAYCSDDITIQAKQQAAWDAFKTQSSTIQLL